ncbi:MAG: hypothetical protein ACRBBN_20585, partial [Methyloligellaceae bacterium]
MKFKGILFSALLGSAAMVSSQAMAGGAIGGNCCADLEERVAELEATTARKGNRKVSLQISGNVAYALFFNGDNGRLNGATPVGPANGVTLGQTIANQSKFRFVGKARINSDLYAGYRVEFGIGGVDAGSYARNITPGSAGPLTLRYNDIFIGSKTFGKVTIGHGSLASDFASEVDLSGTIYYAGGSLNEWNAQANLDGGRVERIRYDSPTLAGFKVSASWQDNETVDVALRYGGAIGDFTVAAAVAYTETEAGDGTTIGSASILHRPTGLSLSAAAGEADTATSLGIEEFWYVKAGI